MASAYVALLSLNSNIEHYQQMSLIFPEKFQIQFLKEKTTFLLQFFEQHHNSQISRQEILDLEIRTKYVALEADCMIDSHAMDQNQVLRIKEQSNYEFMMKQFESIKKRLESIKKKEQFEFIKKLFPDEVINRIMKEFESIKEEATIVMTYITENRFHFTAAPSVQPAHTHRPSKRTHPTSSNHAGPSKYARTAGPSSHVRTGASTGVNNSDMVGFGQHLLAVMDCITSTHDSTLKILPIVGMGGIGKTILTQNVFDKKLVKEHFQIRLWSTISQSYKVQDILSTLLHDLNIDILSNSMHDLNIVGDQIRPRHFSSINTNNPTHSNEIGEKLYKTLFGRRYLIVMDDIWDEKVWNEIKRFFPNNNNGSRIILTTRLLCVASYIGSYDPYKLEYLDEEQSWNLLETKVFAQDGCPSTLEGVGRRIAVSCRGLPLAIVVIAGHLAKSEMTKESWEHVAAASENDSECLKILSLSYDNLPLYLKPCFLFMAIFRKGVLISASSMIKYWVANGILKPIRDQCLEDIAMRYLTDLVERYLISVSERGSTGKIKKFRIHDLLHDLCKRKSSEHKFHEKGIVENGRRLGMETNSLYNIPLSLLFVRHYTLDLSSPKFLFKRLIQGVGGNLWDFRLRLIMSSSSQCTDISRFSSFVATTSTFRNLHTLVIGETPAGNEPVVLPLEIWEMARVRHLIIKQVVVPDPPTAHDIIGKERCVLANLQTLQDVHCFKLSGEVIKRIPNLKKLKMTYTKESESTVEWSYYGLHNLAQLRKLESLSFATRENITALEFSLPKSLRKLTLDGCKLPWEEMTMVGSLPNLEVLCLQNDAFCGREWKPVEGEFCHLKVLRLRNMSFQQWEADRSHFPKLERLILYNVWRLKEIPLDIGEIPTLKFISAEFCRCSLKVSVEQLIEDQRSMENSDIEVELKSSLIVDFVGILRNCSLISNNHPPNETSVSMIEKFEDNLHELQTFISYTAMKQRTDERLKELVKHIRDVMYEVVDITFAMLQKEDKGKSLSYPFRRMVNVVKEVEYVAVKVQRLRPRVGDGWDEEEEFGPNNNLRDLIDYKTDDEAYNFRIRQLISQFLNRVEPESDWLEKNPEMAKYLEPKSSRAQFIFRDFAVLTDVDGISADHELDQLHNVTCDYCEKYPIVGVRYRCKDCYTEENRVGFDLCEECYSSGLVSDHTGMNNDQSHTPDHEFEMLT